MVSDEQWREMQLRVSQLEAWTGGGAVDMDALVFTDAVPDVVPPLLEPGEEITVARAYRLPVELDAWIGQEAKNHGITRSEVIRNMIEERWARGPVDPGCGA